MDETRNDSMSIEIEDEEYTTLATYLDGLAKSAAAAEASGNSAEKGTAMDRYLRTFDAEEKARKARMEEWKTMRELELKEQELKIMEKVELSKKEVGKTRTVLEVLKVVFPPIAGIVPFVLGLALSWNVEKDGRLTTKVSNLMMNQIPKIWKGI